MHEPRCSVCTGRTSAGDEVSSGYEYRAYDPVGRLKWNIDVRMHPIKEVTDRILEKEIWWKFGRLVPSARAEEDYMVSRVTRE